LSFDVSHAAGVPGWGGFIVLAAAAHVASGQMIPAWDERALVDTTWSRLVILSQTFAQTGQRGTRDRIQPKLVGPREPEDRATTRQLAFSTTDLNEPRFVRRPGSVASSFEINSLLPSAAA